MLYKIKKTNS